MRIFHNFSIIYAVRRASLSWKCTETAMDPASSDPLVGCEGNPFSHYLLDAFDFSVSTLRFLPPPLQ